MIAAVEDAISEALVRRLVAEVRPDLTMYQVPQPKEMIVALAARSQIKGIRDDLVPRPGDIRKVGVAYNPRLVAFIEKGWDINAAATVSPSLRRAVDRLRTAF